jgi:hypothetical protein
MTIYLGVVYEYESVLLIVFDISIIINIKFSAQYIISNLIINFFVS